MATTRGEYPAAIILPESDEVIPTGKLKPFREFVPPPPKSLADRLFKEGYAFTFFQAIFLLERLFPDHTPISRGGSPTLEAIRFKAYQSLSFPASSVYSIDPPTKALPSATMEVTFMGLTGPSGVLPRHYTELIVKLHRELRGAARNALRDWLDIFNHRMISLFYRAACKYRIFFPYQRGEYLHALPDMVTQALYCLAGVGLPSLRNRLRVSRLELDNPEKPERKLAAIDDLSLIYYGGLLHQRPRNAQGLRALLEDYFGLPIEVRQFQGQWLPLELVNQTQVGDHPVNNRLGMNAIAGERIWDVLGRIRLRVGPLSLQQFIEFIPDHAPEPIRKSFFLLVHWVRLYIGPELSFDVNVLLAADQVPECQLIDDESEVGARLGWNTWLNSLGFEQDADDAVFEGEEVVMVG